MCLKNCIEFDTSILFNVRQAMALIHRCIYIDCYLTEIIPISLSFQIYSIRCKFHSRFFTHRVNNSSGQIVRVATLLARAMIYVTLIFYTIMWHGRVNICHDWPPMVPVSPVLLNISMVGGLLGWLLSCVYTSQLNFQINTTGFDLATLPFLCFGFLPHQVMFFLIPFPLILLNQITQPVNHNQSSTLAWRKQDVNST